MEHAFDNGVEAAFYSLVRAFTGDPDFDRAAFTKPVQTHPQQGARPVTIDFTKPVQTRDGRLVRILCTDRKSSDYPIIGLVLLLGDTESVRSWTREGFANLSGGSPYDIVNLEPARYMNVYDDAQTSMWYETREMADRGSSRGTPRIAVLKRVGNTVTVED